jgi:hypothetical protein
MNKRKQKRNNNKRKPQNNARQSNNKWSMIGSGPSTFMLRSPTGMADRVEIPLVYEDIISFSTGATQANYVFRGNGAFDPDATGIGHQPKYYDTWAAIYNRYRVLRSSIRVNWVNGSQSGSQLVIIPDTNMLIATQPVYAYAEDPRARKSRIIPFLANQTGTLSHKISTRKQLGLRREELYAGEYSSTVGNIPAQQWFWNCFFLNVNSAINLNGQASIRVTYWIEFYDRVEPAVSVTDSYNKQLTLKELGFGDKVSGNSQTDGSVTAIADPIIPILVQVGNTPLPVTTTPTSSMTVSNPVLNVKVLL